MVIKLDAEYASTNQLMMTVKLSGIDVILSLERKICIPIAHIVSVNHANSTIIADRLSTGMSRAVGVRLGGKSIVGAFVEWERGKVVYWNVQNQKKAAANGTIIVIELRNERYNELVLEVDGVNEAIERINMWRRSQ